jgi:small subunit ribosomal protein S13
MANPKEKHEEHAELIRIKGSDVDARKQVIVGLTKIKGISWSFANALCRIVKVSPTKRISDLEKNEIIKIEEFIDNPKLPSFLKNRQRDFDDGEDSHINGSDLKLKNEFDLKRLKKVKSYRGIRHSNNLPVRGQRTKSNFRRNRKKSGAVGVKSKK